MPAVARSPNRSAATHLKKQLRKLAKLDDEAPARAARHVLDRGAHHVVPSYVIKPYARQGRVRLSKPKLVGWHYVVPAGGAEATGVTVGHAVERGRPAVSIHSTPFGGGDLEAIESLPRASRLRKRAYSVAVIHVPQLMLRALWIQVGRASWYRVLEPSHVEAPRGVLLTRAAFNRLAVHVYRQFSRRPHIWHRGRAGS